MYPRDAAEIRITRDFFYFLQTITMSGTFDGSDSMLEAYGKVRSVAGNAEWLTVFKPIEYYAIKFFILLLKEFYDRHICCAFTGTFPAFLAGVLRSFNRIALSVAVTQSSVFDKIAKRNRWCNRSFRLGSFKFIPESRGDDFVHHTVVHDIATFTILVNLYDAKPEVGRNSVQKVCQLRMG
jgi:hypothetical protein